MRAFKYIMCVLFVVIIASPLLAIEGDVELLKLIADGYETNWEKIRTWGGSAVVEISEVDEKTEKSAQNGWKRHNQAEFLVDRNLGATRWINRIEDITYNQGKEEQRKPFDYSGMVKSNKGCQMIYDSTDKQRIRTMEILPPADIIRNEGSFIFDPQYIWEHIYPVLQQLRFCYENANDPNLSSGHTIVRQGNIVTFELKVHSEVPGQDNFNRLVFDLSKGCNLVELVALCPVNEVRWKLDYEQIGNVFVVKEMSKSYKDKRQGNERYNQMKVTLNNKIVNKPVDSAEFEFDKIGLRPGDNILDRMVGELVYPWRKEYPISEAIPNIEKDIKASPHKEVPIASPPTCQSVSQTSESANVDAKNPADDKANVNTANSKTKSLLLGILGLAVLFIAIIWLCMDKLFFKRGGGKI